MKSLNVQEREVDWCVKHGRKDRIMIDYSGKAFVVGDWSWTRNNNPSDSIEPLMRKDGVYSENQKNA